MSTELAIKPNYVLENKNANEKLNFPLLPQQLPYLRPTQIATLLDSCAKKWAAETLLGLGKDEPVAWDQVPAKPTASQIGTAAHLVIEDFTAARWKARLGLQLTPEEVLVSVPSKHPAMAWIPKEEVLNVYRTIEHQLEDPDDKEVLMALEYVFEEMWREGAPPIRGHIDRVDVNEAEKAIIIKDYKTNRSPETAAEWRVKAQQRLYAWAMRKRFPGYTIHWRIIYINLGYNVAWVTDPAEDEETLSLLNQKWDELLAYNHQVGDLAPYAETLCSNCKWCPLKEQCATYKNSTENFELSLRPTLLAQNPISRYQSLKLVEKLVASEIEATKQEVAAQIKQAGRYLKADKLYWTADIENKREVDFGDAWPVFLEHIAMTEGFYESMVEEGVLSIGVTALDKLAKKYPSFKADITPYIKAVPRENFTLRSSEKNPDEKKKR